MRSPDAHRVERVCHVSVHVKSTRELRKDSIQLGAPQLWIGMSLFKFYIGLGLIKSVVIEL